MSTASDCVRVAPMKAVTELAYTEHPHYDEVRRMVSEREVRIFISYARKDGASLAQRLQSDLTNEGFDTWLDTQRIAGGALWSADIEREVDGRHLTLALLSPSSHISEV